MESGDGEWQGLMSPLSAEGSLGYQRAENSDGRCIRPPLENGDSATQWDSVACPGDQVHQLRSPDGKELQKDHPDSFRAQVAALRAT